MELNVCVDNDTNVTSMCVWPANRDRGQRWVSVMVMVTIVAQRMKRAEGQKYMFYISSGTFLPAPLITGTDADWQVYNLNLDTNYFTTSWTEELEWNDFVIWTKCSHLWWQKIIIIVSKKWPPITVHTSSSAHPSVARMCVCPWCGHRTHRNVDSLFDLNHSF